MNIEAGTRELWLHIVQSANKKDVFPMGFAIRRLEQTGEQFYLGASRWGYDVTTALTLEHLAEAEVLQATLQAERPSLTQPLNLMTIEEGVMPCLQVVFWGVADGEPSYMTALW